MATSPKYGVVVRFLVDGKDKLMEELKQAYEKLGIEFSQENLDRISKISEDLKKIGVELRVSLAPIVYL